MCIPQCQSECISQFFAHIFDEPIKQNNSTIAILKPLFEYDASPNSAYCLVCGAIVVSALASPLTSPPTAPVQADAFLRLFAAGSGSKAPLLDSAGRVWALDGAFLPLASQTSAYVSTSPILLLPAADSFIAQHIRFDTSSVNKIRYQLPLAGLAGCPQVLQPPAVVLRMFFSDNTYSVAGARVFSVHANDQVR